MPEGEGFRLPPSVARLLPTLGVTLLVVAIVLGALFALTRTWPPLVVVETGSMQHGDEASALGVIDAGDIVLIRAASDPEEVVTYVEGRADGYGTYGDFGDVVLFQVPGEPQAIIHRPLFRVLWNETSGGFDIPSLLALERQVDWSASQATPFGLQSGDSVVLHNVTFKDLTLTLPLGQFVPQVVAPRCTLENPCYVTMGDNNAPAYDLVLVRHSWVVGIARGEVPWLGLLKLVLDGTYGWGDDRVPANSWTSLAVLLVVLLGGPLAVDVVLVLRGRRRGPSEAGGESGLESVLAAVEERQQRREEKEDEDTNSD